MAAYVIAQVMIHDREEYAKYEEGFMPIFTQYEGQLVVVSENMKTIEGEWPATRTVVGRFRSKEAAERWYNSPEYQELVRHRFKAADANIILTDAFDLG